MCSIPDHIVDVIDFIGGTYIQSNLSWMDSEKAMLDI